MEKYEDPTQRLQSRVPTKEYKANYDAIFGKKLYWYEKKLKEQEDGNRLGSSGKGQVELDKPSSKPNP